MTDLKPRGSILDARWGLVFGHTCKLAWGMNHGAFQWAPSWAKHLVVTTWNKVACFVIGHDRYDLPADEGFPEQHFCASCCKEWKP